MSQENVEIVRRVYEASNAGLDGLRSSIADVVRRLQPAILASSRRTSIATRRASAKRSAPRGSAREYLRAPSSLIESATAIRFVGRCACPSADAAASRSRLTSTSS